MEELLTIYEVMKVLKVKKQTVQRMVLRKQIPYCKINRMLRFRPCEIGRWIEERQHKAVAVRKGKKEKGLFDEAAVTETALGEMATGEAGAGGKA